MALRNNKVLKFFSLLLFTFGLVGPVVASDSISTESAQPGHHTFLPVPAHHGGITQLLFEETNSEEEREAKDDKHQTLILFCLPTDNSVLSTLHAFSTEGYSSCPIHKLGTHPALFQLYRRILI